MGPLCAETKAFVKYRNYLAHFEVYHIIDRAGAAATPQTKHNIMISESHMNLSERSDERVTALIY